MGMLTEGNILNQLKKAQGETNQRLDALLDEQRRTNQLLEQILTAPTQGGSGTSAEGQKGDGPRP